MSSQQGRITEGMLFAFFVVIGVTLMTGFVYVAGHFISKNW